MPRHALVAMLGLAVVSTAACSSSTPSAAPTSTTSTMVPAASAASDGASAPVGAEPSGEPTASSSIDCETASQADWMEYCSGTEGGAAITKVPWGEAGHYTQTFNDGSTPVDWEVSLTSSKCGLSQVEKADMNPKWQGSDEVPQYIAAKAKPGNAFCVFTWSWKNVGKVPATTEQSGDLMAGDTQFARSDEDAMRSWTVMETLQGVGYTDKVNPGQSTKSMDIYEMPADLKPTGILMPNPTMVSGSQLEFEVKL